MNEVGGSEGTVPGKILRVCEGGVSGEGDLVGPEPGVNHTSVSGRPCWLSCGEWRFLTFLVPWNPLASSEAHGYLFKQCL